MSQTLRICRLVVLITVAALACRGDGPQLSGLADGLPPEESSPLAALWRSGESMIGAPRALLVGNSTKFAVSDRLLRSRYVRWLSSDERVAHVTSAGWVFGRDSGDAMILVRGHAPNNTLKQLRGSDFEVIRMTGVVTP